MDGSARLGPETPLAEAPREERRNPRTSASWERGREEEEKRILAVTILALHRATGVELRQWLGQGGCDGEPDNGSGEVPPESPPTRERRGGLSDM